MPYTGGTFALYSTGNPVVTGTVISSTWANNTLTDIATGLSTCVLKNGGQTITANLPMATFKFTGLGAGSAATDSVNLGQVQAGAHAWCGTAGGTANALTLTPTPAITAYAAGQTFRFKSGASANSGATTVAISGLATIDIQSNGVACTGNEIEASQWYQITVDASATSCQLLKIGVPKTFKTSINTARATVASHATTADIWGAAGNQIDWTGTATTTAFPNAPQAGAERTLICAAACSFTAGANMLIVGVSSGNTVTCAANDQVHIYAISTTQFLLTRYKYDGTPQVASLPTAAQGASLVLLSTVTAANSATCDVETTFDSTYDVYYIIGVGIVVADANIYFRSRLKVGGSYDTGSNYQYAGQQANATGAANFTGATGAAYINLNFNQAGNAASDNINFTMEVYNPSSTALKKTVKWMGAMKGATYIGFMDGVANNSATTALTGVRFYMETGNIVSGTFYLYGLKKA